jgi:hypothetical protein
MIILSGSSELLEATLNDYKSAWNDFLIAHQLTPLQGVAIPTTVSWKVADKAELFANLQASAAYTEQVHIGTVNDRYISSSVLNEPLHGNLWLLKILERRP